MPAANLGRVAHQLTDFVQALPLHRQLTSERVPEVQATPTQFHFLIGRTEVSGEIVRVPTLALGTRKKPGAFVALGLELPLI